MVSCATLVVCAGSVAEELVEPRSWVGSTFVIKRDEFTDALNYKVIIESDRTTLTDGRKGGIRHIHVF